MKHFLFTLEPDAAASMLRPFLGGRRIHATTKSAGFFTFQDVNRRR